MMSTQERVDAALAILESEQAGPTARPAAIIMPPDSGDFIIGNAEGFVRLAIASLRAAKGEKQSFEKESWWASREVDWAIPGLRPDPSAHTYLPPQFTGFRLLVSKAWGADIPLLGATCFLVGLVTIVRWAMHML